MKPHGVIAAHEPPMRGVRRILVGELDRVISTLSGESMRPPAIHEVRKRLKRARAMLRLLREASGERLLPA
jgi:hypothetical protein